MWFCPGANHAPHHAPQEYIDKYKGKFDDGYEAYREWVLPRMIEKGILPEGTAADADEPDARGHRLAARRRAAVGLARPTTRRRCSRRMAEVYAGFSEYTDAAGRPDRRLPRGDRPAREHDRLLLRRQRRLGRGQPERLGQREQVLQRLARRDGGEPRASSTTSAARTPTTTTRPAGRWRSRRRSGCSSATPTRAASATRWSSTGRRGSRPRARCATSTTTRSTSCPTILECCGLEFPRTLQRPRAGPAAGRLDALLLRRRRRADAKERQYYAMLGTRGIWEDGWKAVAVHGPTSGHRHTSTRTSGSSSTPTSTAPRRTTSAERAPREAQAAGRRLVRGGRTSTTSCRSTTGSPIEILADPRPQPEPDRGHVRLLPGHGRRAGVGRRQHPRPLVQDPGRGRASTSPDAEGVIFAHGSRFGGHALFLKDRKLWYVYNFLGIPPEQQFVSERARARQARARHGVHQGEHRRARRGARHGARCTSTRRRSPRGRCAPSRRSSRCAATASASAATPPTPVSKEYTPPAPLQGRDDPPGRGQRRRRPVHRPREAGGRDARARIDESSRRPAPPLVFAHGCNSRARRGVSLRAGGDAPAEGGAEPPDDLARPPDVARAARWARRRG